MPYIADLHIHSHHSMATSKHSDPEHLFLAAAAKGVDLVGTGDLTHPGWRAELAEKLVAEPGRGLFRLRPELEKDLRRRLPGALAGAQVNFVLSGEISSIYKKDSRARKVHNVVLLPDLESVERLCTRLEKIGNIHSDGRPILGLDCRDLLELTLEASGEACFIPAHIWTPHFSVFGSNSGFDRLEDCYGDLTGQIYALETGLSSDPPMNWRVSALDRFTLVSNSDAHSPEKLAREANLIEAELSYRGLTGCLRGVSGSFAGTVEFYPEEGKYHYDGHRACGVRLTPRQTADLGGRCPVCGGKITEGVLNRVEELADRPTGARSAGAKPYERLIPLAEVLAECLGVGAGSGAVRHSLDRLLANVGSELHVLRSAPPEAVAGICGPLAAEALRRNREGRVRIEPGFDGQYGTVTIFEPGERELSDSQIFFGGMPEAERKAVAAIALPISTPPADLPDSPTGVSKEEAPDYLPAGQPVEGIALNERQLEAVTAESGPVAVIAGPGTGKTRCLAGRAAWLVAVRGVKPEKILAVTFTNRAAREMSQRIGQLVGGEGAVTACTLHSWCLGLLARAGGAAPSVADETDRAALLRETLSGGGLRVAQVSEAISRAKALGQTPETFRGPESFRAAYTGYRDLCRRLGILDYDDLILEALARLESDSGLEAAERERCEWLLVDEFQDINPAQYGLIRRLAGEAGPGLFVIGDPDQSIYGFRGADGRVFERLAGDYPHRQMIRLERGYRCPDTVASAAAAVIAPASPAGFRPPAPTGNRGAPVMTVRAPGELAEAIAVVREVSRLVGGTGMLEAHGEGRATGARSREEQYSFADVAVAARTARLLEGLETAFVTEGIPCRLRGARSFLEDAVVRNLLAFLRLLVEPGDDLRFLGALRLTGLDPGNAYFSRLRERAAAGGRRLLAELKRGVSNEVPLKKESGPAADFLTGYERFRRISERPPAELVGMLVENFVAPDERSGQPLTHLAAVAAGFESLREFISRIALAADGDLERPGGSRGGAQAEAVTLLTMHAAKGLEFRVVFVCGVEEGLVPFTWRETDPAEERRLLYVAMTRASARLYLTSSEKRTVRGQEVRSGWSPFVESLPAGMLEPLELFLPERSRDRQLGLF